MKVHLDSQIWIRKKRFSNLANGFLVANLPTHSQTFAALGRALDGLVGADTSARRTWAYNQMAYPKKKKLSLPT
jgi:hypothetical protein